jgi:hypothetical protein
MAIQWNTDEPNRIGWNGGDPDVTAALPNLSRPIETLSDGLLFGAATIKLTTTRT